MKFDFKQARIISGRTLATGTTYQVKVLPEMENISESDLFPYYPNFFKNDHTAHRPDDIVWVLCNEDFLVGFILGQAQGPTGEDNQGLIDLINQAEAAAGFEKSGYGSLSLTNYGGRCFSFTNTANGQSGTVYNNKIIILYGSDGSSWYQGPNVKIIASANGDLSITGKVKTESFDKEKKDVKISSVENVGSKTISSTGILSLKTGGTYERHAAGKVVETSTGFDSTIVGTKSEVITGLGWAGETKTILTGGSTTFIPEGTFTITVLLGAIAISSGGPIAITSGTNIALTASANINLTSATITMQAAAIVLGTPLLQCFPAFVPMILSPVGVPGIGCFIPG